MNISAVLGVLSSPGWSLTSLSSPTVRKPMTQGKACVGILVDSTSWAPLGSQPSPDTDRRVKKPADDVKAQPSESALLWKPSQLKPQTSRSRDKALLPCPAWIPDTESVKLNKLVFDLYFYGWASLLAGICIWNIPAIKLWLECIWYRAIWKEMW